jgi:uncharacterized protein
MIRLFLLSLILIVAGLIHLITPEVFLPVMPEFIPFHLEIIYLTGILELVLGVGLVNKKTQDLAAKSTALYFLLLLPLHIYVSIRPIEIFGISSPLLLWGRTLFQFVFIFWALSLQTKSWIIQQVWKDLVFLHYEVDPKVIEKLVPFKLDLYNGKAILSIVPFKMEGIRFPFLPPIPWVSQLWELNIRTYVELNGVKGVYFFTLESDSKIAELVAQKFFYLPYRYAHIKAAVAGNNYQFQHKREGLNFKLTAKFQNPRPSTDFDLWATERYSLFTRHKNVIYRGVVSHKPWTHTDINICVVDDQFTKMVTNAPMKLVGSSYAQELKVRFTPFQKVPHTFKS